MFRKQHLALPSQDLLKTLEEVIDEIDEQLKEHHCPIEMSVPIIPFKARVLREGDRAFTTDNFEARALFKSIKIGQRHPMTRSPLYFQDIGDLFIINKELIQKVDDILLKNGYTRNHLLKHYRISSHLFEYLYNANFSRNKIREPIDISNFDNVIEGLLCTILILNLIMFFFFLTDAKLYKELHQLINQIHENINNIFSQSYKNPNLISETKEYFNSILANVINTIGNIPESGKYAFSYIFQPKIFIPAITITSTSMLTLKTFHHFQYQKTFHDENKYTKIVLTILSLAILLLGFDALTDSVSLVNHITPKNWNQGIMGLIPAGLVIAGGIFGKIYQKSKNEIAFEEFKKNDYEYYVPNKL